MPRVAWPPFHKLVALQLYHPSLDPHRWLPTEWPPLLPLNLRFLMTTTLLQSNPLCLRGKTAVSAKVALPWSPNKIRLLKRFIRVPITITESTFWDFQLPTLCFFSMKWNKSRFLAQPLLWHSRNLALLSGVLHSMTFGKTCKEKPHQLLRSWKPKIDSLLQWSFDRCAFLILPFNTTFKMNEWLNLHF